MAKTKAAIAAKLQTISTELERHFGLPERNARNVAPLTVLIATVLSQNTNDRNSFKAYNNLRQVLPAWRGAKDIAEETIRSLIKPAGLVNQKASTIKTIFEQVFVHKTLVLKKSLLEKHDARDIINTLTRIKGVGVKTASCVLLFALERNVCPVDTHVHRLLNRLGVVRTGTPEKTFWAIYAEVPNNRAHSLHTNLIRLGRSICKPTKPVCGDCPLNTRCQFPRKSRDNSVNKKLDSFLLLDSL